MTVSEIIVEREHHGNRPQFCGLVALNAHNMTHILLWTIEAESSESVMVEFFPGCGHVNALDLVRDNKSQIIDALLDYIGLYVQKEV